MNTLQEAPPRTAARVPSRKAAPAVSTSELNADSAHGRLARLAAEEVRKCVAANPQNGPQGVLLDKEVDGYRLIVMRTKPADPDSISLSPREIEIARMIAKGYPNKTIAGVLEISSWTVGTHLRRIFAKLRVSSRAAMVSRMLELRSIESWTHV